MSTRELLGAIAQSTAGQWALILSLIFGGCCSNAWALELATSKNPHAGTLITFAQFLIVTLSGLRKQLIVKNPEPLTREQLVSHITLNLLPLRALHPSKRILRVAISGSDAEHRQKLGDDLRNCVMDADNEIDVIRSSPDSSSSKPKGKGGALSSSLASALYTARSDSILIIDGEELLEDDLKDEWDYSIYLQTPTKRQAKEEQTSTIIDYSDPSAPVILSPRSRISRALYVRFKPLAIPLSKWMIQVVLYWATSLLNNIALGYDVSLAVHIIFRSGGLCSNMVLGYMIGKRYSWAQVVSVLLVTAGVISATASSMGVSTLEAASKGNSAVSTESYTIGITLLTVALFMSSAMGLAQEIAYTQYGRGHWEEGMFYLHFLGLPMFAFVGKDLVAEIKAANASSPLKIEPRSLLQLAQVGLTKFLFLPTPPTSPPAAFQLSHPFLEKLLQQGIKWFHSLPNVTIPSFYVPLLLNIVTQLICVSGVHRLTSRVSSLTVTLVLVVRKAVSLWISVIWVGGGRGNSLLWGGAAAVLLGTILYSVDGVRQKKAMEAEKKKIE